LIPLNFFGKLAYLVDIGVLTRQDIGYFEYYIVKAKADPAVMQFAKRLHYELFLLLLDQTGRIDDNESRDLVAAYRNRTKQKFYQKFGIL
jgi:hypothetical protein